MNEKIESIEAAPTRPWRTRSGVMVGALYRRTPAPYHDRDAVRLQSALLAGGVRTLRGLDWDGVLIAAGCVVAALCVLVPFWVQS